MPVVICLHSLGRELQLGQVDVFLLLLLALTVACAAEGRSDQAGLWLAAAICLKVMPVVLLFYPLWRRDWRWLLSCASGLVFGLVILPLFTLSYDGTVKYSGEYVQALVLSAVTEKVTDHSRDGELLNQNAVHNFPFWVSFIIWKFFHWNGMPARKPPRCIAAASQQLWVFCWQR